MLKTSDLDAVVLDGATQALVDVAEKQGRRTELQSFRDISLGSKDEDNDKGAVSPGVLPDVAVSGNMLQVPQSTPPRRSGSEVSSEKPPVSTLAIRAQVTRAATAASANTEAFSLLLVDDNVSKSSS